MMALNRGGSGKSTGNIRPLPEVSRPSKPINSCDQCGAMFTGTAHTCH